METIQNFQARSIKFSFNMPSLLLRAEGLVLFVAAVWLYGYLGYSGLAFALLLLSPDLSFLMYALDKRAGSIAYNLTHFMGFPLVLSVIGLLTGSPIALQAALIWFAHIGMDRTVGYGFMYMGDFKKTHLQSV